MEEAKKKNKSLKEFWRVIKYGLIAASAGIIEFGVETLMCEVFHIDGDRWWISYTVALTLSVIWNFTINRKYTFKSIGNVPIAMLKVLGYYAIFGPGSVFFGNWLIDCGWPEVLVTLLNMLINVVTEYLFMRFFVFGKTIDTAPDKKDKINEKK